MPDDVMCPITLELMANASACNGGGWSHVREEHNRGLIQARQPKLTEDIDTGSYWTEAYAESQHEGTDRKHR
jgi:hypothetical protein